MDEIILSDELKEMYAVHAARIDLLKKQVQLEELDLRRVLKKIHGIDLSNNWELDLEGSVLRRVSATEQP